METAAHGSPPALFSYVTRLTLSSSLKPELQNLVEEIEHQRRWDMLFVFGMTARDTLAVDPCAVLRVTELGHGAASLRNHECHREGIIDRYLAIYSVAA